MALTPAYFRKPRAKAKVFKRNTEVGGRTLCSRTDPARRRDTALRLRSTENCCAAFGQRPATS